MYNAFGQVLYGIIPSESKFKQIEHIQSMQTPNVISVMTDSLHLTQRMVDYAKHSATTKGFRWNIFLKVDSGTKRAGFDITDTRSAEQRKGYNLKLNAYSLSRSKLI